MKGTSVRAVDMVRRIRDRQAKALAGKSAAEVIAFYRAAGKAVTQDVAPSVSSRRTPANTYQPSPRQVHKPSPSGRARKNKRDR